MGKSGKKLLLSVNTGGGYQETCEIYASIRHSNVSSEDEEQVNYYIQNRRKILFWGPAPIIGNESWCPFVAYRIYELQKQGWDVEVVLPFAVHIAELNKSSRKGILKHLANLKHFIKFMFIKFCGNKISKKTFSSQMGEYIYYDLLEFSSWERFYKWFVKNNFLLIHGHFLWFAEQLPFIKERFGIPYVITCHGSDVHETPFIETEKVPIFLNIMKNANKVIFVSNSLRNKATEFGYDNSNAITIYNGYDSKIFYPEANDACADKNFVLGFVGHPIAVKRADILPEILLNVKNVLPQAKLIIVGSERDVASDLIPDIKKKVDNYGLNDCVEFVPEVSPEKVGDYMRKIDVLLFPSKYEGFGAVVIEAQACGKMVVGSSNGGIPEAIGDCGIAVIDDQNFIKNFSNAIVGLFENPIPVDKILKRSENFTWQKIAEQEIAVYNSAIKNDCSL